MKKLLPCFLAIVLVFLSGCTTNTGNTKNVESSVVIDSTTNTESTAAAVTSTTSGNLWDNVVGSKVTKENFADQYYYALINEPLSGIWTQEDITYFLTKCVQKDLKENEDESKFAFVKNQKVSFLYIVSTSTSPDAVLFLIDKEGENRKFPHFEFVSLLVFLHYNGDNYDDLSTYTFETNGPTVVSFDGTDDFIKYINDTGINSVFFERGWLEIK